MEIVRRGEIWVANLNPTRGREIGKIRPALVIQANELTQAGNDTVVVLPLTTQGRPDQQYFRVPVPARNRLLIDSYVVVDKPRALDRSRFGEGPLATLTDAELATVDGVLRAVLGMS